MAVVTISRQLGSGGDEIAARVVEGLGYRYFDKHIMVETAAQVGLCESEVVDFSEERYKVQDFITRLFRSGPRTVKEVLVREEQHGTIATLTARSLDERDCAALVRYAVENAYEQGRVVIVGRGGQAILHGRPGVLHVRIIAPDEVRLRNLRDAGMSGISEIKRTIADSDRASAEYLRRFYDVQWDDPAHYHLVLNTGLLTLDAAAGIVIEAARQIEAVPA